MENNKEKFSITKRLLSFKFASEGIVHLIKTQHNAWIHLVALVTATILGFYYTISSMEWCILIICFGLVLSAEAFNSAIETLADKVEPNLDPKIKTTKDLAAGAVLLTAIASLIIGGIIFIPKITA